MNKIQDEDGPAKRKVSRNRSNSAKSKATQDRPDLYIGLVGAVGTDLANVRSALQAQFAVVGYRVEYIKVSELIHSAMELEGFSKEQERVSKLMRAGDCIRASSPEGNGVAAMVINRIRQVRGDGNGLYGNTVFIIDSLKNPAEIDLFDDVYVRNYYTISVYLSREERQRNLAIKIARDVNEPPGVKHETAALKLINEDEKGRGKHSQNVQETFPRADYFINSRQNLDLQAKKFVDLVFGEPFATPTFDEYNMFLAKAAGYRTSDLSRQVGAVIVDRHGSVAGMGCNEVPYPGGGIYDDQHCEGIGDNRDFVKQVDPNYIEIQKSLIDLIRILRQSDYINDSTQGSESDEKIADNLLQGSQKELMSSSRFRNIIEFGRIVHAEMHAICDAAATGKPVRDATLYCTTFPCHVCARHIIAAGIAEVVYIEPYPKSLTSQLYADEIQFAHEKCGPRADGSQVVFRPFHGTSPTLFQRVFQYRTRKNSRGIVVTWEPLEAIPQGAAAGVVRPNVEAQASLSVEGFLEKAKARFAELEGEI